MRRAGVGTCLAFLFLFAAGASGQPEEPFRPKGGYNNSVHRFHPDLDARLNVVRFTRWRTLEIAWVSGAMDGLDKEISAYTAGLMKRPPRHPPEADRVAPLLASDAAPIFRALRWGQTLEQQLLDVLASSDANKALSAARLERALLLYRRERWALSEPAEPSPDVPSGTTAAWRIEVSGMRLFVRAAADLVTPDFAQQRWRVKQTIADFDRTYEGDHAFGETTYATGAPAVAEESLDVARVLDRVERLRLDVLEALAPAGATPEARRQRKERLRAVARRYGLPAEGIGER
jgi:hypothetical protein